MSQVASAAAPPALASAMALTQSPEIFRISRDFDQAPEAVFAYLSDTDRLHEWIPMVRGSQSDDSAAEAPQGVGSVRLIDKGVGEPVRETIRLKDPPHLLAYSARDQDFFGLVLDHLSILGVEPLPGGGSRVTWISYGVSPGPIRGFLGRRILHLVLRRGLRTAHRRMAASSP